MAATALSAISAIGFSGPALAAVPAVVAGATHACALTSGGTVSCWGNNYSSNLYTSTPTPVAGITTAQAIAAFGDTNCVLLTDGQVRCWGGNAGGQLGNNNQLPSSVPVTVQGVSQAVAIAVGGDHACAILQSGQVQCWGKHRYNRYGLASGGNYGTPFVIPGIAGATAMTATTERTCVIVAGGQVQCWGRRFYSTEAAQDVGPNPPATHPFDLVPTLVEGFKDAIDIAAVLDYDKVNGSANQLCAVLASGVVQCRMQSAMGSRITMLEGIDDAASIRLGVVYSAHSGCVLLRSGIVKCFGDNAYGALGSWGARASAIPVAVPGVVDVDSISAVGRHTCALLRSGNVTCWGVPLGVLTYGPYGSAEPVDVRGLGRAVTVAGILQTGGSDIAVSGGYNCAVLADGRVQCWGANQFYQLGDSRVNSFSTSPVLVQGVTQAISVVTGLMGACALNADRSVLCWGDYATSPWQPEGLGDAIALTANDFHFCALRQGGQVSCWGGQGLLATRVATPVPGVINAVALNAVEHNSCALLATGEVDCWYASYPPTRIAGLTNVTGLSKSARCAVVDGQSGPTQFWCWNNASVLNAAPTAVTVPQLVTGLCPKPQFANFVCLDGSTAQTVTGWGEVSMGTNSVFATRSGCALLTNGSVKCQGDDGSGQLGSGRLSGYEPAPVLAANGTMYFNPGLGKTAQETDAVFTWAEKNYADVFVATGSPSIPIDGYRLRAYPNGHFLGVNGSGTPRLYYKGPLSNNGILDLGSLAYWLGQATPR
ncbi:MAG: hypothetical protein H7293_22150 [Candidatus Saccharibacteria bacterium]|nr:hypothetical protein [Rhodoferax sp.]